MIRAGRTGLLVGATILALSLPLSGCDWSQRGASPGHARNNPTETSVTPANAGQLVHRFGEATDRAVSFPPVATAAGVFVGGSDNDAFTGTLFAFPSGCSRAACTPQWRASLPQPVSDSPTVAGDQVYIGAIDGTLYAFPRDCGTGDATCTPLWRGETHPQYLTAPVVAGDTVYVSGVDTLYAFPRSCGTGGAVCPPRWRLPIGFSPSAPTIADGVLYIADGDGDLFAYPATCGAHGGTCTPLWTAHTGGLATAGDYAAPAAADGLVFVGAEDGTVYAFPTSCNRHGPTCTPLWTADVGGRGNPIRRSVAVGDGHVFVSASNGTLYAFDERCNAGGGTCEPEWTAPGAGPLSSPSVGGRVVYAVRGAQGATPGTLDAYSTRCGTSGQTCPPLLDGARTGLGQVEPIVAYGTVYTVDQDGTVGGTSLPSSTPASARAFRGRGGAELPSLTVRRGSTLAWRARRRGAVVAFTRAGRRFTVRVPSRAGAIPLPEGRYTRVHVRARGPWRLRLYSTGR